MRKYRRKSKLKARLTIAMMIFAGLALTSLSAMISMGTYRF
jgi:hypothetical protein